MIVKCTTSCPQYYSVSGSVYRCETSCSNYIDGIECVASCPNYYDGSTCVDSCPNFYSGSYDINYFSSSVVSIPSLFSFFNDNLLKYKKL